MAKTVEYRQDNPKTAYEPADWRLGAVGWIFLGTFVFLVIAPLVLMWAYPDAVSDAGRQLVAQPPAPRLQTDPQHDLVRFRAAEQNKLDTYYWIDKSKGIVHIPIAAAMKRLAGSGIPGFPKAPQ